MARPRKQKYDPGQLTLFDIMAGHIENIRAENIQADLEEEKSQAAQPGEAVAENLVHDGAQHDSSLPYVRLGVNSKGEAVYEMNGGGRMTSRNPELMQALDGDKDTPSVLYSRGKHHYLTVEEVAAFAPKDTFTLEAHHARQTNKPAGNSQPRTQARNDTRSKARGVHQFSLLDLGSVGAEQPGRVESPGSTGRDSLRPETLRPAANGSTGAQQRISPASEAPGHERLGDSGAGGGGHGTDSISVTTTEAFRSEAVHRYGDFTEKKIAFGYVGDDTKKNDVAHEDIANSPDNQTAEKNDFDSDAGAVSLTDTGPVRTEHRAENYRITAEDQLGVGGAKTKFADNIAAIRLLKQLQESGVEIAGPEEKKILVRYVGWGGLPQAFDPDNEKWAAEYRELQSLLPPDEYAKARRSTQDAHFTSETVIRGIYQGLAALGLDNGEKLRVLEPSAGIGNFMGLCPENINAQFLAVELDPTTAAISTYLYPEARHLNMGFQNSQIRPGGIDAVVGNPPFGNQALYDRPDRHRS